jgi:hypothetical protein
MSKSGSKVVKVVKKLSTNFVALGKTQKKLKVRRRRRRRRRRRLVFPRPGADFIAPGKNVFWSIKMIPSPGADYVAPGKKVIYKTAFCG